MILDQEGDSIRTEDVKGLWVYGPPGSGKSHYARMNFTDIYIKAQNKWFDGYVGQKVILLDDFDTSVLGHYLKIWSDKWECSGEIKGGTVNLKHTKFIITSNYLLSELWKDDEPMRRAIERRFEMKKMMVKYNKNH